MQLNLCDQNPQKELIYYPWTVLWTLWCSGRPCVISAVFACAYMSPHSVLSTCSKISTCMFGIHWAHRCLCSSFACQQKFHKEWFFFQCDLEVLVSCDTQKCNHSCLELILTLRGESGSWHVQTEVRTPWAHTSVGCCAAHAKLHPVISFSRSLSLWIPSIQWVTGCSWCHVTISRLHWQIGKSDGQVVN